MDDQSHRTAVAEMPAGDKLSINTWASEHPVVKPGKWHPLWLLSHAGRAGNAVAESKCQTCEG